MGTNKIVVRVVGIRGFPNVQGGAENHCEELYKRLVEFKELELIVYRRTNYVKNLTYKNINFIDVWSPKSKYFEAFYHTFVCVLSAVFSKTDVVHFHNIGPGIFIPIVRLFGKKAIITYHSQNYLHNKWNALSKILLKLSERISLRFANRVIFVAEHLKTSIEYRVKENKSSVIYNGIRPITKTLNFETLKTFGIIPKKYVLSVGRLTEEKGFDYLIRAFSQLDSKYQLVLVGGEDVVSGYSRSTKELAEKHKVILTGIQTGEALSELYSHALLFVLPSYHEGLPLTVLEAMSYNLDILMSDIPANKEIGLNSDNYFRVGDVEDLKGKLKQKLKRQDLNIDYSHLLDKYDWFTNSVKTFEVIKSVYYE